MRNQKEYRSAEASGNPEPKGTDGGEELREVLEPLGPAGAFPLRTALLLMLLVVGAAALLTYLGRQTPAGVSPGGPTVEKQRIAIPQAPGAEEEIQTVVIESKPIALPVPSAPDLPSSKGTTPPGHASPAFILESGLLVGAGQLAEAEKAARRLGLSPVRMPVRQMITLTRLKVGEYPPAEAEAKTAELAATVPSAFSLPRGEKVVVFAATYYDIDKARSFADRLFQKGIRVEEEQARVPMTVHRLRLGRFPDLASAERASSRARGAGLETGVVELR